MLGLLERDGCWGGYDYMTPLAFSSMDKYQGARIVGVAEALKMLAARKALFAAIAIAVIMKTNNGKSLKAI